MSRLSLQEKVGDVLINKRQLIRRVKSALFVVGRFWNLPSLLYLQGFQQLRARRACHQVLGVQDHRQLQQHQALPGDRDGKLWFIFNKTNLLL